MEASGKGGEKGKHLHNIRDTLAYLTQPLGGLGVLPVSPAN